MFSATEFRQNLLGCLEVALFMPSGVKRFSDNAAALKKSFIIPALGLPITLATVFLAHPHDDLTSGTANILMGIYSLRIALYLGLFLGLVYVMAKKMDKLKNFGRFAVANNWMMLPAILLMIVPLIGLATGHYSWADIQPILIMLTFYSCACTAFMATHVMRIPWELAGFVALSGLAIHQSSLDVLKWVAINTVSLVS